MLYNKAWEHKPNPLVDVLLKAADLLEKHGHAKRVRQNHDGGMCLLGALDMAQGNHPMMSSGDTSLTYEAATAIVETLHLPHKFSDDPGDQRGNAVNWNNAPERTAQEVIDALRLTAHTVAAKEKETV